MTVAYLIARLGAAAFRWIVPATRAADGVRRGRACRAGRGFPIFATTAVGGGVPMNLFTLFAGG